MTQRMRRTARWARMALCFCFGAALVACAPAASAPTAGAAKTQAATIAPPAAQVSPAPQGAVAEEAAKMLSNVHWLGHASFKLTGEKVVYIDPWQISGGEPADIILITHDHSDHCSPEDVAKIRGPSTVVVAAGGCAAKLGEPNKVKTVRPGEQLTVQGVPIETVAAYNPQKSFHPKAANGVGYVVTLNGIRIYHAGDTDHTPEMDAVRADVALLPVGGKYTMTADEAAAAANIIRPQVAVPMHWGGIVGNRQDAEQFMKQCQVPVQILEQAR